MDVSIAKNDDTSKTFTIQIIRPNMRRGRIGNTSNYILRTDEDAP